MTRILGIDPGSRITGYGIIDIKGNHAIHITHGCIHIDAEELPDKLLTIFGRISDVVTQYHPEEMAIERVFMHRNADSALKLGQARGAAITACATQGLKIFEYTANQVKQATVGKGHAAKEQVQHMVKVLLCLEKIPQQDSAEALGVALCHGHSRQVLMRMREVSGISGGRLR